MGKIGKLVAVCGEIGPFRTAVFVARRVRDDVSRYVRGHLLYWATDEYRIKQYRRRLSSRIEAMCDATILYGPFKGTRLSRGSTWGVDRASMYFGLYEQEILTSLASIPATHRTFVDIGAADGYYSVGAVASGLFDRCYCFEQSAMARNIILENARLNGVADQIIIHGSADQTFHSLIPEAERSGAVLLVDIEGGEFDLLDDEMLRAFRRAIIFIELHGYAFIDGGDRVAALKARAARDFTITELTMTARDLSKFPELRSFSDTDRWLICAEGRGHLMQWLRLDPKAL
jgi:hypothetical protein